MPFGIKLKKKHHYNVASNGLYVICVELLDSSIVECTLSVTSSGWDCLDNVCQRLSLNQPEFFGLRYVSRRGYPRVRWIDLDRPLKKQLDRHAQEVYLYLRVMFYVPGPGLSLIKDETTRYHYFLQLKADVSEGRLRCTLEEAIPLAAYSLQAEFADYDHERHSVAYLRDFVLVPRHLVSEAQRTAVTEAVARQYSDLQGISQGLAECCYLLGAQKLDGYGQECFLAKNEANQEVLVAASLHGVFVRRSNTEALVHYRWDDIVNLVNQKRTFGIECQEKERNVIFTFESSDAARYVWRLCVLQHTFFKQNLQNLDGAGALEVDLTKLSLVADTTDSIHRPCSLAVHAIPVEQPLPAQLYDDQHFQLQKDAQNLLLASSQNIQRMAHDQGSGGEDVQTVPGAHTPSNLQGMFPAKSQHDLDTLRTLLPAYRKAPDYATALHQKYGAVVAEHFLRSTSLPAQPDFNRNDVNYYSAADNNIIYLEKDELTHQLMAKPPPPYPFGKINSYSSPNLALDYQISSSHPNLVNAGNSHHGYHHLRMPSSSVGHLPALGAQKPQYIPRIHHESHRTYENLSNLVDMTVANGKVAYSNLQIYSREDSGSASGQSLPPKYNDICEDNREPIYQNLPTRPQAVPQARPSMPRWAEDHLTQSDFLAPAESFENIPAEAPWSAQPPKITHPKPVVSKDSLLQALETRVAASQLQLEFELLPKRKTHADFATGAHPENAARNRFTDILPYEENRVRLAPSRDNRFGYINASHISASFGGFQKFYIAAQAPLSNTLSAFWQSVWESDVRIVILLSEVEQMTNGSSKPVQTSQASALSNRFSFGRNSSGRSQQTMMSGQTSSSSLGMNVGKESCAQYWPMVDRGTMDFGEFRVTRVKSHSSMVCRVAQLTVTHISSGIQRTIWHLHYTLWSEGGVPTSSEYLIALSEELESIRKLSAAAESPDKPMYKYNRNRPVYVQCASGVGRTGVFILFDMLRHSVDFRSDVDVSKVLLHMRQQRMGFVPTLGQYRAVYQSLISYLKGSRLI